jgi:hypothetical protein
LAITKKWLLPDFGNLSFLNKTNPLLRLRRLVQGLTQVKTFSAPWPGSLKENDLF